MVADRRFGRVPTAATARFVSMVSEHQSAAATTAHGGDLEEFTRSRVRTGSGFQWSSDLRIMGGDGCGFFKNQEVEHQFDGIDGQRSFLEDPGSSNFFLKNQPSFLEDAAHFSFTNSATLRSVSTRDDRIQEDGSWQQNIVSSYNSYKKSSNISLHGHQVFDELQKRLDYNDDEEARVQATKELLKCIIDQRISVKSLASCLQDEVIHICNQTEQWLMKKSQQQDSLPRRAKPVLWSQEIRRVTEALNTTCRSMRKNHLQTLQPACPPTRASRLPSMVNGFLGSSPTFRSNSQGMSIDQDSLPTFDSASNWDVVDDDWSEDQNNEEVEGAGEEMGQKEDDDDEEYDSCDEGIEKGVQRNANEKNSIEGSDSEDLTDALSDNDSSHCLLAAQAKSQGTFACKFLSPLVCEQHDLLDVHLGIMATHYRMRDLDEYEEDASKEKQEEEHARNVSVSNYDGRSSQAPARNKLEKVKPTRPAPNGHASPFSNGFGLKNSDAKRMQSQKRARSTCLQPLPSKVHAQAIGTSKHPVKVTKDDEENVLVFDPGGIVFSLSNKIEKPAKVLEGAYVHLSSCVPTLKDMLKSTNEHLGNAPAVIARGGFSGLFPDSSSTAYTFALIASSPDTILWCDGLLTKDGVGVCLPNLKLDSCTDISEIYQERKKVYLVNGVSTPGWFSIDFNSSELAQVSLTQGIYSRTDRFDASLFPILAVEDVERQFMPPAPALWLNIQHDIFYSQHNLRMRSYVLSVSKRIIVSYLSSPEVGFLNGISPRFQKSKTKLVF